MSSLFFKWWMSSLFLQIEQIGKMPRAKQKFITEMLDALIIQQQTAQG